MSWKLANAVAEKQIGEAKLLALILALHCFQDSRSCHPSIPRLARLCETSERAVYKMLGKLKCLGFLSSEGSGGRGNRTTYTLHPDALPNIFDIQNPVPQGTLFDGNPVLQDTETLSHSSQNPVPQFKRNKEEKVLKRLEARGVHPTLDEVTSYCQERGKGVNPEVWHAYYEANGWKMGCNPIKDWKAAVRYWERPGQSSSRGGGHEYETAQERRIRKNREAVERATANLHLVANNR